MKSLIAIVLVSGLVTSANAGVAVQYYGNPVFPPALAGPFALTPGIFDTATALTVTSAPLSTGTTLNFSSPLMHTMHAPAYWGRAYTGGTYTTTPDTSVTMVVTGTPVLALAVFAIPAPFGVFSITATGTASGGGVVSDTQPLDGTPKNGGTASGWGFYGTGGSTITSITISSDVDFTVGEFYYNNPAPSASALLGLAGVVMGRRRR